MLSKIYKPKLKKGITRKLAKKQKLDEMKKITKLKSENSFHQPKLPERLLKRREQKLKNEQNLKTKLKRKFPTPFKKRTWQPSELSKKEKTISILTLYFEGNT